MYKGNLTKKEALYEMLCGKKIGREYFSSEEYIEIKDPEIGVNAMYFEDGVKAYPEWWNNIEPTFSRPEDGKAWYVFKEKND